MGLFVIPSSFQNDDKGRAASYSTYDFYETGGFVRKEVFEDSALTIPLSNPVVADKAGRFSVIYMNDDAAYRVVYSERTIPNNQSAPLKIIWTEDDIVSDLSAVSGVSSIASVENLSGLVGVDGQQISLLGWHPDSDVGGGTLYFDEARDKSDHNGGTVFSPTVPWTTTTADYLDAVDETDPSGTGCWVRADVKSQIDVYWFGAVDGVSTANAPTNEAVLTKIQSLIDGGEILFNDIVFSIGSIEFSGTYDLRFTNATIYGVVTTPTDQVVRMHNYRQSRVFGTMIVESDGTSDSPTYMLNYGCGVRLTSDNGSSPTQFLYIDGIFIRYITAGIVSGNLLGDSAQASFPQSEIFIKNYKQRGVEQVFYGNATNGYITFSSCIFSAIKFESGSWFDDNTKFNLRNDAGDVISVGDEFQISAAGGNNIYGEKISIESPVWEQGVSNYITGDISISNVTNGFFGSASTVPFIVDPSGEGRLLLDNCNIRRPDGTADSSRSLFVDCIGNNDFKIHMTDCIMKDFAWISDGTSALFVRGGEFSYNNLRINNDDSTSESYFLPAFSHSRFTSADQTGGSMAVVLDLASKNGWSTSNIDGGFGGYIADTPPDVGSAIRMQGGTSSFVLVSPSGGGGSGIVPSRDYLFQFWLKKLSTTDRFQCQVVWYDWSGAQISSSDLYDADEARMDGDGFDEWQKVKQPMRSPDDARTVRIAFIASTTSDVAVSSVEIN